MLVQIGLITCYGFQFDKGASEITMKLNYQLLQMSSITLFPTGRVLNDQTSQDHNLHRCKGVHHRLWAQTHCWRHSEENTWRPEAVQSMPTYCLNLKFYLKCFILFAKEIISVFLPHSHSNKLINTTLSREFTVTFSLTSPRMTSC